MLHSRDSDGERIRNALHNNLLLLGFSPEAQFQAYGIKIDKETFKVPNHKAFQIIARYLLLLHQPAKSDEIKRCWPVVSKKDERDFRSICYKCLRTIVEADPDANFPYFSPSLFLSPGGQQFCLLFLAFTRYIMSCLIKNDFPEEAVLPFPKNAHEVDAMRAATVVDLETFKRDRKSIYDITSVFEECSRVQCDTFWKTAGKCKVFDSETKKRIKPISRDANEYYKSTDVLQEELLNIEKVEVDAGWENIENLCSALTKCSKTVKDAIRDPKDQLSIDGRNLVPDSKEKPTLESTLMLAQKTLPSFDQRFSQFRDAQPHIPQFKVSGHEMTIEIDGFLSKMKQRLHTIRECVKEDRTNPADSFQLLSEMPDLSSWRSELQIETLNIV